MTRVKSQYEKDLLRGLRGSRRSRKLSEDDGLRTCSNVNCESMGLPQSEDNFYLMRSSGSRDHYCVPCRRRQASQWKKDNPRRVAKWRLGTRGRKSTRPSGWRPVKCLTHPDEFTEDCGCRRPRRTKVRDALCPDCNVRTDDCGCASRRKRVRVARCRGCGLPVLRCACGTRVTPLEVRVKISEGNRKAWIRRRERARLGDRGTG